MRFSWDPRKAKANERKHGITFEEASSAFFDEDALVMDDPDHSDDEDRFVLLGLSYRLRLVVVCHALREEADLIRLISARKAVKQERTQYSEQFRR
jgi:uncharacterized DUF497 family protein